MGEFQNWDIEELMVLMASLRYVYDKAENDYNEPVMQDLRKVIDKVKPAIEIRLTEMREFGEIIENCLGDVALASEIIVKNPNVEIPEYN